MWLALTCTVAGAHLRCGSRCASMRARPSPQQTHAKKAPVSSTVPQPGLQENVYDVPRCLSIAWATQSMLRSKELHCFGVTDDNDDDDDDDDDDEPASTLINSAQHILSSLKNSALQAPFWPPVFPKASFKCCRSLPVGFARLPLAAQSRCCQNWGGCLWPVDTHWTTCTGCCERTGLSGGGDNARFQLETRLSGIQGWCAS